MMSQIPESLSVSDDSEIMVTGQDAFGAAFTERTRLVSLAPKAFTFTLFRPLDVDVSLRVNFRPDDEDRAFWVSGKVISLDARLDGQQRVVVTLDAQKGLPVSP